MNPRRVVAHGVELSQAKRSPGSELNASPATVVQRQVAHRDVVARDVHTALPEQKEAPGGALLEGAVRPSQVLSPAPRSGA